MSDAVAWALSIAVVSVGVFLTWRWHRGRRMRLMLNPGYTEEDVRQLLTLRQEAQELVDLASKKDGQRGRGDMRGRLRRIERKREEIMRRAAKRRAYAETAATRAAQRKASR